jgi:UDP-N-acetylmuramoylalanine--D-glutamate ligase
MSLEFQGKRVTVMGLGAFGGGVGAVQFLVRQGARVTVTDLAPARELAGALVQLEQTPPERLCLGEHCDADFRFADLIIKNPAVPPQSRYLQVARDAGVPITTELNLFWQRNPARTACVTGSNGKSTTAALAHAMLSRALDAGRVLNGPRAAPHLASIPFEQRQKQRSHYGAPAGGTGRTGAGGRCWLGGNIGQSLLPLLEQISADDWVVLELSSFQLEDLAPLQPRPDVSVVTNFTPNHLDRHGTIDHYRAAKQNILRWQGPDQVAVLNQDDPDVCHWKTAAATCWFGRDDEGRQGLFGVGFDRFRRRALLRYKFREQVLPLGEWFALPGEHQFLNALAAACAALVLGSAPQDVADGLRCFRGLPHRLERLGEWRGRTFINDSKATTPEAAIQALAAFRGPVVLIAGGYDKGLDLLPFAAAIVEREVRALALVGQTAEVLARHVAACDPRGVIRVQTLADLPAAFAFAVEQSRPGDLVMLSPGCASYGAHRHYAERGEQFARLAREWGASAAS